jgi:hypothetical protein
MTRQLEAPHTGGDAAGNAQGRGVSAPARQVGRRSACSADICGYRVFGPDGYVGVVEHVGPEPRLEGLAVLNGLFVPRSLLVPFAAVQRVIPEERRVLLRRYLWRDPKPAANGSVVELLRR